MGFFKNLGAKMGIGGIEINLELPSNEIRRNEKLKGKIHIKGGEVEQQITGFLFRFVRFWEVEERLSVEELNEIREKQGFDAIAKQASGEERIQDDMRITRHDEEIVNYHNEGSYTVAPSQEIVHEFTIQIAPNMTIIGDKLREEIKLKVTAQIEGAADAECEMSVKILESENTRKLRHAMYVKYSEACMFITTTRGSNARGTEEVLISFFESPEELKDKIDQIRLEAFNVPEGLDLTIILDTQEHGIKDVLKAAIGKDVVQETIRITTKQLDAGDEKIIEIIDGKIQELLAKIG